MTFSEWLDSRDGQDTLSDAIFGDKGQRLKALERTWRAGHQEASESIAVDDLELSMADLPEGA